MLQPAFQRDGVDGEIPMLSEDREHCQTAMAIQSTEDCNPCFTSLISPLFSKC